MDAAKRGLGERGPAWWTDGAPDYNRHLARNTPYAAWFAGLDVEWTVGPPQAPSPIQAPMARPELPPPPPPNDILRDDIVELRLLRVLGPADAETRRPEERFLAVAPECRFAIHRRSDGARVGRIHLRLTDDAAILRAVGHSGYAVDEAHRRQGYAARALTAIRRVARHYGIAPLWVLIDPANVPSRRTAERAGLRLVDTVAASPEALALGLGAELCRYVVERP